MFLHNTVIVSLSTLLSRILGYVRDVILASSLGAGPLNDIFIIAFRIPNFFRTIFGEGAFSVSFIPIYSGMLESKGKSTAQNFASLVQTFLFCSVIIFSVFIFILMPEIIILAAPGVVERGHGELATNLSRISISYLVFISMVAFYGGILNSIGKYFAFAATPILLNLSLITAALLGNTPIEILYSLTYGIIIAGILEIIWIICFLHYYGYLPKIKNCQLTSDIKLLARRMLPGLVGSGLTQINLLIDTIIASLVPSAISYLYYAERINQLPMALIGTSMGIVILPILTKIFQRGDIEGGIKLHNQAINLLLLIAIPAAFAFSVLGFEIVEALFQRDAFTQEISIKTAKALIAFAIGLPAFSMSKIFITNFYANGDTKTPVKIALLCIMVNAALSLILLDFLSYVGIALASSLASWLNIFILWRILVQKNRFKFETSTMVNIIKYIISSIVMAGIIMLAKPLLAHFTNYLALGIMVVMGMGVYTIMILSTKATSISEIRQLFNQKYYVTKSGKQ